MLIDFLSHHTNQSMLDSFGRPFFLHQHVLYIRLLRLIELRCDLFLLSPRNDGESDDFAMTKMQEVRKISSPAGSSSLRGRLTE